MYADSLPQCSASEKILNYQTPISPDTITLCGCFHCIISLYHCLRRKMEILLLKGSAHMLQCGSLLDLYNYYAAVVVFSFLLILVTLIFLWEVLCGTGIVGACGCLFCVVRSKSSRHFNFAREWLWIVETPLGVSLHTPFLNECGKRRRVEWLGLLLVNVFPTD
jgi:hypothetical protein